MLPTATKGTFVPMAGVGGQGMLPKHSEPERTS